jgi:beta-galactosidase
VTRDELVTAGAPHAIVLTPDKREVTATSGSLVFLSATVVDAHGVVVPDAANTIRFAITGAGRLAGVDNGQQESALSFQVPALPAFNGKAAAIVAATGQRGAITVVATSPGLVPASTVLRASGGTGTRTHAVPAAVTTAEVVTPAADASFSGAPNTVPAAMLDGSAATGWSNFYVKSATATLRSVSRSRATDWVALSWPSARTISTVTANFVTSSTLALPATVQVSYWDGHTFRPVRNQQAVVAATTTITFDPVSTDRFRLTMTSPTPDTAAGFLRISALRAD